MKWIFSIELLFTLDGRQTICRKVCSNWMQGFQVLEVCSFSGFNFFVMSAFSTRRLQNFLVNEQLILFLLVTILRVNSSFSFTDNLYHVLSSTREHSNTFMLQKFFHIS